MQAWRAFAKGEFCRLGRIEFTTEAIKEFAAVYDPQPQHLDEQAAKATPLQGLAASGWQTCAVLMRNVELQLGTACTRLRVAGVEEIRWLKPVRPGDMLETRISWEPDCACTGCRDAGGRTIAIEVVNHLDEPVLRLTGYATFARDWASPIDAQGQCVRHPLRMSRVRHRPGGRLVRYFEDVDVGDEIALGSYDFTPDAMRTFTRIVGAAHGGGERFNASGWHVVAAWMRRIVDHYDAEADFLGRQGRPVPRLGPAVGTRSLRWLKPVRVGDRITFNSWAEHKVRIGTSRGWGLLVAGAEGRDQNGELVVSLYPQFLLQKKPA